MIVEQSKESSSVMTPLSRALEQKSHAPLKISHMQYQNIKNMHMSPNDSREEAESGRSQQDSPIYSPRYVLSDSLEVQAFHLEQIKKIAERSIKR